jgi:hypothetical protein
MHVIRDRWLDSHCYEQSNSSVPDHPGPKDRLVSYQFADCSGDDPHVMGLSPHPPPPCCLMRRDEDAYTKGSERSEPGGFGGDTPPGTLDLLPIARFGSFVVAFSSPLIDSS